MTSAAALQAIRLDEPENFLRALADSGAISLDEMKVAQIWGLVALASLSLEQREDPLAVDSTGASSASRFAHAVGFADLVDGSKPTVPLEPGRTVRLRRVTEFPAIEPAAREIAQLLVPGKQEADVATRRTVYYVLVELLRNVIQHSADPLGAVVAAQVMSSDHYGERPMIQVSVADCGVGIPAALAAQHPDLASAEEALEKALWPHWSGTFAEGLTGSLQNAGMGLFFVAEMAKLTAGRLLIATRGAALFLTGDLEARTDHHELRFLQPKGLGFPGTLVTFELPSNEVNDYDALMQVIAERARERTPLRAVHRWFRYDEPPEHAKRFVVTVASEDTVAAEAFSEQHLQPALIQRTPVALNFANMQVCTQSFLHALLFEAIRIAWARRTPIYVQNVSPAVRSGLELLEAYALGG